VSDPAARAFYEIEAERENWSTPHLERQIFTALHLRLLKSRNKAGLMELARKGQTVERPSDLIKSPLILDFLGLSGRHEYRESDLETAIINKLSQFLLELGKGFAFVARQKRISFDDDHLFIDLVIYNILLKCYLLIDLKLRRLTHQDVGQMDSYVRIFDAHERAPGDGPTIGLILCAEENHTIARYSVLNEYIATLQQATREAAISPDEATRLEALCKASNAFTKLLRPHVTRRRRSEDELIQTIKTVQTSDQDPQLKGPHPHRNIRPLRVSWTDPSVRASAWIDVLFAAECMSHAARGLTGDDIGHSLKSAYTKLCNGHVSGDFDITESDDDGDEALDAAADQADERTREKIARVN
jgi:predicted nuclease of restriction endonuclease-like (RecB) superfamily